MLQESIFEAPELESQQDLGNFRLSEQGDGNVHPASGGPLARFAIANIKNRLRRSEVASPPLHLRRHLNPSILPRS